MRENGEIEYVGRRDNQMKIRGYRVELGEVERVMMEVGGIKEAAVVAREAADGETILVGYIVGEEGLDVIEEEVRKELRNKLPEHMVPQVIEKLEQMPLTANGKVDRKELLRKQVSSRHVQQEYIAPRTAVEERVASIWSEVLGVDRIGVFDNFFDLGGHSLLLTSIGVKLSESFDKNVSVIEMFKYPTISSLAEFITTELNQEISFQKSQSRTMRQKEAFKRRRDRANGRSKESG